QDRSKRLVLRRRRHLPIHGQMIQERLNLRPAQLPRVAPPVKANQAPDPREVSSLRPKTEMSGPNPVPDDVQEPRRHLRHNITRSSCGIWESSPKKSRGLLPCQRPYPAFSP